MIRMLNQLLAKIKDGNSFKTTTAWVLENDETLYTKLVEMMQQFVAEEDNLTYEEDLEEFEKGNWLVEYSFWMEDKETVVIDVLCGRNEQELANQPEWVRNRIKIEELEDYLNIGKVIKMF